MEIISLKVKMVSPAAPTCLPRIKSSNKCGETFAKKIELESHMVQFHGLDKTHACEICGKLFYNKLRMKMHRSIHECSHKPCKFFQAGKDCPFNDVCALRN